MNEVFTTGLITTVVGMGSVFVILILLTGITKLTGFLSTPKAKAAVVAAPPVPLAASGEANTELPIAPEVIAAIAAAISLVTGQKPCELHFTAIRRVGTPLSAWTLAGNNEIMRANASCNEARSVGINNYNAK